MSRKRRVMGWGKELLVTPAGDEVNLFLHCTDCWLNGGNFEICFQVVSRALALRVRERERERGGGGGRRQTDRQTETGFDRET